MKKLRRILLRIEAVAAGITGFFWTTAICLNTLDEFPDLPFSLGWFSLLWMPLVLWAFFYLLARAGQVSGRIMLINEKMRRPELYSWILGVILGVLTFLGWLLFR